jgi:hypothetical protein
VLSEQKKEFDFQPLSDTITSYGALEVPVSCANDGSENAVNANHTNNNFFIIYNIKLITLI